MYEILPLMITHPTGDYRNLAVSGILGEGQWIDSELIKIAKASLKVVIGVT